MITLKASCQFKQIWISTTNLLFTPQLKYLKSTNSGVSLNEPSDNKTPGTQSKTNVEAVDANSVTANETAMSNIVIYFDEGEEMKKILVRNLYNQPLQYKFVSDSYFFVVDAASDASIHTKYITHSLVVRVNLNLIIENKDLLWRVNRRRFFCFGVDLKFLIDLTN